MIEVKEIHSQTAEVIPRRVTLMKPDLTQKRLVKTKTNETLHI